jgi:glyoxylase-like metal-dependent hydrolase (beta-lactamase superfamily II)/rhodanese-related sulfurtransferase
MEKITSAQLGKRLESDEKFLVLDVRDRGAFNRAHIEGRRGIKTLNIPYSDVNEKVIKEKIPKDLEVVVVCFKGISAGSIAKHLNNLGHHVSVLDGGMEGWFEFVDQKKIVEEPHLAIYQFVRTSRGCLSYVVVSDGEAIVIDPLRNVDPYVQLDLQLKFVIDTHAHADHISGGSTLAKQFNVPYYLHPYDGIHPIDVLPAKTSYEPSWEEKVYSFGKGRLRTIHIPGHTLGNMALLLNDKYLFSGDSIFLSSVSRPDLGGKADTWTNLHYASLQKLMELPDSTLVLPAHFSSLDEANEERNFSQTLGHLKKSNEGLVMAQKSLSEFSEYILSNLPKAPPEYIDIKRVNIGLMHVDEQKAQELESGKNICAVAAK